MGAMQKKVWFFDGIPEHDPVKVGGWGGSDSLRWWRRIGDGARFHVVDLIDMDDACGRDNDGHPKYAGELAEVDTSDMERARAAARSWGFDDVDAEGRPLDDNGDPLTSIALALCMFTYGAKAPLWSDSANCARDLVREARRESRALEGDAEAYEARMARPVNALGSTAAEFARGDMASALGRGLEAGDKRAGIIAQMYRACDGQTLGAGRADDVMKVIEKHDAAR